MSTFTTELRYMLESMAGYSENQPASKVNSVIEDTRTTLFDFPYPCTNLTTSEKEHLEKHIMLHFYFKEIGFETFGLFKTKLQSKLWDIMPKYDALYATEHLQLDFFNDVDYTRKLDSQVDRDGTDTKSGSVTDANSGYDETSTTGKIISQNSGSVTNVKTGSETVENSGYTENVQTGSITDSGTNGNTRSETGSYKDTESGTVERSQSGSETDTDGGSVTKTTNGKYTDTNTGNVINLDSDTPQQAVDFDTDQDIYVSSLGKRIDDTTSERTYTNLTEQTTPTTTKTKTFTNRKETTTANDHATERTFDDYQISDSGSSSNTKTFNSVKSKDTDATQTDTTYNSVTDTQTDTKKNEQSFDNYKVRNTDTKQKTQTFNNLMNTIDNTDITDLTERIYGNVSGNNIKKLVDYRDSILNLELMIIKDLKPLFMGLFM